MSGAADPTSFDLFAEEGDDWLNAARAKLLAMLVGDHLSTTGGSTDGRPRELLEIGAGSGQNLAALASFGAVDALEVSAVGRRAIAARKIVRHVYTEPLPAPLVRDGVRPSYDVIAALDVIEHIEDDRGALVWTRDHLREGGLLVATVPAYPSLFSDHDRALHHYRRYTCSSFATLVPPGMHLVTSGYFVHLLFPVAVAARAAWTIARRVTGAALVRHRSPRTGLLADAMGRVLDAELGMIAGGYRPPFGLSVFAVARRDG